MWTLHHHNLYDAPEDGSGQGLLRALLLALGQINLTVGQWQYDRWREPDYVALQRAWSRALGLWMGDGGSTTVRRCWKGTLECACWSLMCFASQAVWASSAQPCPPAPFRRMALYRYSSDHSNALRRAPLPYQNIHTENLTPFLKFLLCTARAGVATLLKPHKLFNGGWHGLAVNVERRVQLST